MRKSLSFLVVLFLILSQFSFLEFSFALTAADVTVTPPIAGHVASYDIQFTLGTGSGYAIPETGYIKISFPTGTTLPTSMDKSCVTVNGSATLEDPKISGTTIRVMVPSPITAGSNVTVAFSQTCGIKNPASSTGNLRLKVETGYLVGTSETRIEGPMDSNKYFIGVPADVTVSPNTDGSEFAEYKFVWKVGNEGALSKDTDEITIEFDAAYITPPKALFSGKIPASYILVNSKPLNYDATCTTTPLTLKFKVPVDVTNSSQVTIILTNSVGMVNPTAGVYQIKISTTKEPTKIDSNPYTIYDAIEFFDLDGDATNGVQGVVVNPYTVSVEAEYKIGITINVPLSANYGTITIAFPTGTTLPSTIPASSVIFDVDGTPYSLIFDPLRSGNNITITVPTDIAAGAEITIDFLKSIKIKNPSKAGIYTLQVMTSAQPYYRVSPPYAIGTSVTNVKVTPTPDTKASNNVQYVVEFKVGANGALTANEDKIYILLKVDAPLPPSNLPSSSVLVGTDYTIVQTVVESSAAPDPTGYVRFIVTPPKDIGANQTVKVTFLPSAGITNPTAGNYKGYVRTSKEPILMDSPYYLITDAVEVISVTVDPPAVSVPAKYEIKIKVGTGLLANSGTITIVFPSGTTVPTNIPTSGITIQIGANPPQPLNVVPTVSGTRVTITVPAVISSGDEVTITFLETTGVKNPSKPGIYNLQVMTSTQPYFRVSPSYSIGSSVTEVKITPMPNNINATQVEYKVEFKLGLIPLSANHDKIIVEIPATTTLTTLQPATIIVNNTFTTLISSVTAMTFTDMPSTGINSPGSRIEITTPVDLRQNQAITIVFLSSCGFLNPSSEGNFFGYVYTSLETIKIESALYNIVDSVAFPGFNPPADLRSVLPSPNAIKLNAQYLIHFKTSSSKPALQANIGTISIVFPADTKVPSTISPGSIYISTTPIWGGGSPDSVKCPPPTGQILNQAPSIKGNELTITVPIDISAGSSVYILICLSANIQNPSNAGLYTLQIKTSIQPNYGVSRSYLIRSTIDKPTVLPVPSVASENAEYSIAFKTGTQGDLTANVDKLYVAFNGDFYTTPAAGNLAPSTIKVNGVYLNVYAIVSTGAVLPSNVDNPPGWSNYKWIEILTPIDIKASSDVTIQILLSAGLKNPATSGNYTIIAWTTKEPIAIESYIYSIGEAVKDVTVGASYPNPKTSGSIAEYLISFKIGSNATSALSANSSTITVTFPEGTKLPSNINPSDIKIGTGTPCDPTNSSIPPVIVEGQSVRFVVPMNIAPDSEVCVKFLKGAKITNPDTPGSYRLKVRTSSQPIDALSNYYTILSTSSIPKVTSDPPSINAVNVSYSVEFNVGSNGSLAANIGKIVVFFDPSYSGADYVAGFEANPSQYPLLATAIPPNSIFVNDAPVTSIVKVQNDGTSLKYIEIITPVDIVSSGSVNILFAATAGIKNPPTVGSYRLAILTSSEPTPVESIPFSLFSSISIPNVTLSISDFTPPKPKGSTPNAIVQYAIDFQTGPAGNLARDLGTITVMFPYDTTIPTSFPSGSVKVKVGLAGIPITLSELPKIDVATRSVTLTVPTDIPASTPVQIIFSELSGIRNPTNPGNYTLKVSTSSEPIFIKSNPYVIEGLSSATVSVNPCTQDISFVTYRLQFSITNALSAGNFIIVEFPYLTKLPSVITGSNVLVNGKPANVGAFPQVEVNGQVVKIKIPENINALSVVTVEFLSNARITNPPMGSYRLKVMTDGNGSDIDNRFVESHIYEICGAFVLTSVEINPSSVTLAKGEAKKFTAIAKDENGNEITAGVTYNWSVQGVIGSLDSTTNKEVNFTAGQTPGKGKLIVQISGSGITLTAEAQITISASLASVIVIPSSATVSIGGIQVFRGEAKDELGNILDIEFDWTITGTIGTISPIKGKSTTFTGSSAGSGTIKASATFGGVTKEATASITVTTEPPPPPPPEGEVVTASITPATVRAKQTDVSFTISVSALIDINNGIVEINVPEGFPVPTNTPGAQGFVDAVAGSGVNISVPPTIDGRIIRINIIKMNKGGSFTVSYSRITAPDTPADYKFIIKARKDASSPLTEIASSPVVKVVSVADGSGRATVSPSSASAGAIGQTFTITFTADAVMDGGAISITIPEGWSRPTLTSTGEGYVKIKETDGEVGSIEVLGDTITVPIMKLGINQKISITYSNVTIPSIPGTFTFVVKSKGPGGTLKSIVLSPSVEVKSTRITDGRVEVNPNTTMTTAEYIITFKTSETGFLAKDSGTITFIFPAETNIPDSIKSELISVNDTPCTLPLEIDSIRSTITLTVPIDIQANSLVKVKFPASAGIINPKTPKDDYKIMISTSTDSIPTPTATYKIIVSNLRDVTVTVSPIVPGVYATYTIKFTVGGAGALNINTDSITIIFPSDTVLPSTIPANAITVNGTPLQVRPQIDIAQRKITLFLPVRVENDSEVTVVILTEAKVQNPTKDGMYKLKVFTSKETNPVESSAYQIGTSLLGDVKVSLSSSIVSAENVTYTISFRTGAYGELKVGDTITVTFDRRYRLPSIQAYQVTVNGVVCTVTPEIRDGVSIIINTPIAISSQSNVTVTISGVKNPEESGEYTISVATQVEPMPVMSTPYRIGMVLETKVTVNPENPNGLAGWYTIAPNIIFTNDVTSSKIYYSWDDQSFQLYTGGSITAPEGIHILNYYSTAEGFDDEPKKTMQFKVDTRPPVVTVTRPTEGSVFNTPEIVVEGEVLEANNFTVSVNGKTATIIDKKFTATITLEVGDNIIDIIATDEAGNRSITPRIRVSYVIPSEITITITSPKSLSVINPYLKPIGGGSYQLIASIRVIGRIDPVNADTLNVYILGKMETPITISIAQDGSFDGTVELPVVAGLNGITFSVKDKITSKEYSTSVAVVAKITIKLQIGNALAFVNDKEYRLDAPPYIKNSRTMLPMRFIGEAFGAVVGWVEDKKMVTYDFETIHIELIISDKRALVRRGEKSETIELDVAPEIIAGRTFVPLRFVSETLGAEVEWIAETKSIIVKK